MKSKTLLSTLVMFVLIVGFSGSQLGAQSHPEYIPLGGGVKGALYKPDSGAAPHVGILVMHRTVNFLSTTACTQLSSRIPHPTTTKLWWTGRTCLSMFSGS